MPDWENIRVFLAVARSGSFRAAAAQLGLTGQTVANRIAELEHQLGAQLFARGRAGAHLTADGDRVLDCATQMEEVSFGLVRRRGRAARPLEGEVRIAVTEGLGTFWVTPRLLAFLRAHPNLLVDLHCSMQRPDERVLRAQADLAIQIEPPIARDLMVKRLGRMHIMPCASQAYLDTYGCPQTHAEIAERHRIVMQYADQGRGREIYDGLFPGKRQTGFMALRTDVSTALYAAVVNGLALGWMPTYYFSLGAPLVPLDIDLKFSFDIWLSFHPDAGAMPRVRRLIDWVTDAFDPRQCPWFRDEFIHPSAFEQHLRTGPLPAMDEAFGKQERYATANMMCKQSREGR